MHDIAVSGERVSAIKQPVPTAVRRSEDRPNRQSTDETFLAALGKRVRETREQRRMARKVLAEAADVSERYLAQLECGTGNASVLLLRHVANALNVPMTHLLGGEIGTPRARLGRFLDSLPERRVEEVLQRLLSEFGTEESV